MTNHGLSPHERGGFPSWTCFNSEMYELEIDVLFRRSWQLVCHVSDVAAPGSTHDALGRTAIVTLAG
jgi:phenylpropionate dioxygenase-like ring-hydroxylating dioxygenase large terminal subunit